MLVMNDGTSEQVKLLEECCGGLLVAGGGEEEERRGGRGESEGFRRQHQNTLIKTLF